MWGSGFLAVPRVYLDLDVLSYMVGLPRNEVWKIPVARRISSLARNRKVVIVVSKASPLTMPM